MQAHYPDSIPGAAAIMLRSCNAWSVATLCLLLVASGCLEAASWDKGQKYLLPVVNFGPNNQLRRLRYLLALAKQLNRTVILPSIVRHHRDREMMRPGLLNPRRCLKEDVPHQLEFSEVLDREFLQQWMPVTTTAELYAQGWSGSLDTLAFPGDHTLDEVVNYFVTTVQGVRAQVYHNIALVRTPNQLHCSVGVIKGIKEQLKRFKVVAMYWTVVGHTDPMYLLDEGLNKPPAELENGCFRDVFEANRLLRASWWLTALAKEYVRRHVGSEPFMALHVRPQNDGCLDMWSKRDFTKAATAKQCWSGHSKLHLEVGPKTAAMMQQYNLTKLVVVTHPKLNGVLKDLLVEAGVHSAQFVIPSLASEIAGCVDETATLLMLVEMQVAAQSAFFLGTASSSITETIIYERLANGIDAHGFLDKQAVGRWVLKPTPNYAPVPPGWKP